MKSATFASETILNFTQDSFGIHISLKIYTYNCEVSNMNSNKGMKPIRLAVLVLIIDIDLTFMLIFFISVINWFIESMSLMQVGCMCTLMTLEEILNSSVHNIGRMCTLIFLRRCVIFFLKFLLSPLLLNSQSKFK